MWRNAGLSVMTVASVMALSRASTPGAAQSTADLVTSTREEWVRCLKDAYPSYAKKTPNQNYAADMTLQACSMYEERLWGLSSETGVTPDAFEKLKTATKKALTSGK